MKPYSLISQKDLSDLELETLAPYIPMDGEDFQLSPIVSNPEPTEATKAGSMGSTSNLKTQLSFSNIANLFQPLSSPSHPQGCYQSQSSWATEERRGSSQGAVDTCGSLYMQNPSYKSPASTPLSSMQWPPDPLITYQQQPRPTKAYLMDSLSGEERPSCQQNMSQPMQKQR